MGPSNFNRLSHLFRTVPTGTDTFVPNSPAGIDNAHQATLQCVYYSYTPTVTTDAHLTLSFRPPFAVIRPPLGIPYPASHYESKTEHIRPTKPLGSETHRFDGRFQSRGPFQMPLSKEPILGECGGDVELPHAYYHTVWVTFIPPNDE